MTSYRIEWKRSAVKELKQIDKPIIPRIIEAVEQLAANPYPVGSKKIRGAEHTFRIRKGEYRIVYRVYSGKLIVEIVKVGHRKRVYEKPL